MRNPYLAQPAYAFWSRAVSRVPREAFDPVVSPKFQVDSSARVATAGSCFARHIAAHMLKVGMTPMVTEAPHPELAELATDFHYGVYTARYGNIYTARQMLQLLRRAFGSFIPSEPVWRDAKTGVFVDPFRPLIPGGFATLREFEIDRERHLSAVRKMFTDLDCLVFTLGLTEGWRAKADGAVFPSCPGAAAGEWDPEKYEFVNFTLEDVIADLTTFWAELTAINPGCRMILTVSPVSLVATATDSHVLLATTYSKAVLRVAADVFARGRDMVDYFPSYDIVTGPQARGQAFEADCREVRADQVALVMKVFARHYLGLEGEPSEFAAEPAEHPPSVTAAVGASLDVICDEIYNDAQATG